MKKIKCLIAMLFLGLLPVQAAVPVGTDFSTLNSAADMESAYRNRTYCAYRPISQLREQLHCNIPATVWQNSVAFEAYDEEGNLLRIALRGLNHKDNATTDLICPAYKSCAVGRHSL